MFLILWSIFSTLNVLQLLLLIVEPIFFFFKKIAVMIEKGVSFVDFITIFEDFPDNLAISIVHK